MQVSCGTLQSTFFAIALFAFLSACGSKSDTAEEATTISQKFLEDGKIWLPKDIRCGSIESITDDSSRFLKFEIYSGGPYFWGPIGEGLYQLNGSEFSGYEITVFRPKDYDPNFGMEMPDNYIWNTGAESVTARITRVGENLLFGDKLYHPCGENTLEEGMLER
ncbi:MAG: hypothetical protein RLZZ456_1 [Pseudomonadota bacterium]